MVFVYIAQYIRESFKNMFYYYKDKPEPVFKKPDGYKNINAHSFIKVQN